MSKTPNAQKVLMTEAKNCFRYFVNNMSTDAQTYGLMPDKVPTCGVCSIAATGFALAALVVGAQLGFGEKEQLAKKALKTLTTVATLDRTEGFFYHFYQLSDGSRAHRCEVSSIDTALLIAGAVTAGEFFGAEVKRKAYEIYDAVNWNYFVCKERNLLRMARYDNGFSGWWDCYAEQLVMYVLGCGATHDNYRLDPSLFYSFARLEDSYAQYTFVHSWFGSLFTHQFSHAFVNFQGKRDKQGMDWFANSVTATLAARQFCIDQAVTCKGYGPNAWGLTSCCSKGGYEGRYGSPPSGNGNIEHVSDGTLAPAGAIGSLPFTPELSLDALCHYACVQGLQGEYGLLDAYNTDQNWISKEYISIDKGISLLAMANYLCGIVNDSFERSANVQAAYKLIGLQEIGG